METITSKRIGIGLKTTGKGDLAINLRVLYHPIKDQME